MIRHRIQATKRVSKGNNMFIYIGQYKSGECPKSDDDFIYVYSESEEAAFNGLEKIIVPKMVKYCTAHNCRLFIIPQTDERGNLLMSESLIKKLERLQEELTEGETLLRKLREGEK